MGAEQKFSNIIFEGPDGAGKSTIASSFVKTVIGFKRPEHVANPSTPEEFQKFSEEHVKRLQTETGLVFDRGLLGEKVYGPILRGYYPEYMDDLEKLVPETTLLVLVTADVHALEARYDGKFVQKPHLRDLRDKYFVEFMESNYQSKMILDTTFLPANIVTQHLLWAVRCRVRR